MESNFHKKKISKLFLILNLIFGLYFLNYPFNFVKIPESFSVAEPWIIFGGGILILLGIVSYFRIDRKVF